MRRTYRKKYARDNELRACFTHSDEEPATLFYTHKGGSNTDLHLMNDAFTSFRYGYEGSFGNISPSFVKELLNRGYDITTFEFRISKLDTNDSVAVNINNQFKKQLSN